VCAPELHSEPAAAPGESRVELSADAVERARQERPLLRSLLAVAAGFSQGLTGRSHRGAGPLQPATFIFCVKGKGWWEAHGRLSIISKGDLLVLPPGSTHACGPQASSPWTVHWVRATGEHLPDYLRELALGPQTPVLHLGEDPQLIRLFSEILHSLQRGPAFPNLLQASHALAYLLAGLIQKRQAAAPESSDTVHRVAQAIVYMSEHLDAPLRVTALARLAGLSRAHFGELFKAQTGSSPHDYLHLLRIHQACRLLRDSTLSVKEIAARIGYRDPFHFSRQFKAFQGRSPSEYRDQPTGPAAVPGPPTP
jgi:AraC family transcriptional regulator, arabinose operon regulatory protein